MNTWIYVLIALVYLVCIAITDGLFNRLVFGNLRLLKYHDPKKMVIYNSWEWRYIGIFFLLIMGIILPMAIAFMIGGWRYSLGYWMVFAIFQWDVIFGKIVFDDWWGDEPSWFLPGFGRVWMKLSDWMLVKFISAVIVAIILF